MSYRGQNEAQAYLQGFNGTRWSNNCAMWVANGGATTVGVLGFGNTTTGTATARTLTTVGLLNSTRRLGYVSAAAAGSSAGTRFAAANFWRGNAAGLGGFDYLAVFGLPTFASTSRFFVGLQSGTAVIGNVDPSSLTNILGFGADIADANVQLLVNDAVGTATKVDLGASFVKTDTNALYQVRISCVPNETWPPSSTPPVICEIAKLNTTTKFSRSLTADIPTNATLMQTQVWVNNGTVAAAVAVDVSRQSIVTRF
jgi:hypothetical protein